MKSEIEYLRLIADQLTALNKNVHDVSSQLAALRRLLTDEDVDANGLYDL